MWYVTECSTPVLYKVNPYSAEAIVTNDVKYDFDEETGTLTVSGKGSIPDFRNPEGRPFEEYKDKIKKVVLEGDIYTIGEHAFSDLENVEEIYVESETFAIGNSAFSNNKELTVLVLPDNVNSMGSGIITGDDKLELLVLPDSVDKADLGEIYFKPFTEIFYEGSQEKWDELTKDLYDTTKAQKDIKTGVKSGSCGDTAYWVYDPSTKELDVYGSGEIDVKPDGGYPWSEFAGEAERLDIQEGITVIPDKAFTDFAKMKEIVIPETVEKIGEAAFAGNDSSDFVIIPDSVKEIGEKAFGADSDLNLRDDFTIYGTKDSAAKKLAEEQNAEFVEINGKCGETAAYIVDEAHGKLTIVGTGDMYDYKEEELPPWDSSKDKIKKAEITDGITRVGNYAIWGLDNLKEVTIPSTVEEIGKFAISNDPELRSIIIETVDFTEEFADFFNDYGTDRTFKFTGTEEQWNAIEHPYFVEGTDTVVFDYVAPPEPETTTGTTAPPVPTVTTTAPDDPVDPTQPSTSGGNPGDPTQPTEPAGDDYLLGDVTRDGIVDSSDASELLSLYAQMSTGGDPISEDTLKIADVNFDGMADSSDASLILEYYAYISTGGDKKSNDYFHDIA